MGVLLGSSQAAKTSDLSSAISSILLSSGAPIIRDGTAGRSILYSARHDGLVLILSRFLRPIWSSRVTMPAGPGQQVLGVPQKTLLEVQSRLEGLRTYIDEYPFPRHHAEGDVKVAWDQEELSLHALRILVTQTIEAISFVLLLADYKMGDIVAK
jgi:nuclear pore complex protein Nup155